MRCARCAFLVLLLASAGRAAPAQSPSRDLSAELFTGTAWSLPLPLTFELPNGRVRIRARYSTRPFADSPYYSYRVGRATGVGHAIEAEMLHHKLYLENPTPPIDRFEATHGYNLVTANVVAPANGWQVRFGVGLVVAHPEGRIAGRYIGRVRTLLGGVYHIAGMTTQLAVGRRYPLGRARIALTAAPEAKVTASWARTPIAEGRITMPNAAVHLLGGLGVRCRC